MPACWDAEEALLARDRRVILAQRDRLFDEPRDPLSSETRSASSSLVSASHPLDPERLDVERGERGAVGHRAAQQLVVDVAVGMGGDVADESAGEAVAGAGRVDDRLERERGQAEEALLGDIAAPYSPCLATTTRGPHSRI